MGFYLAKRLGLGMLFEAESGKVNPRAKNSRLCKDTDTSNPIQFHFHVRIAIRVTKVGEMRPPCCIFGVSLDNDRVFIQSIS